VTSGLSRRTVADPVKPSINVTPLVDVVLVLLIIFMVVVPQLAQDVPLDLPGIFNPDAEVKSGPPFRVSIPRAGEYYYESERLDLDGLIGRLEAEHAAAPQRRIVLRADAGLRYAAVREVQHRLQEVGFPGMSFEVTKRHRWDESQEIAQR